MEEEPQYDYAYDNSELKSNDEKKERFLKELGGLMSHVASKVAQVGSDMGADFKPNPFNSTLSVPNGMNSANPLAPEFNRYPRKRIIASRRPITRIRPYRQSI